MFGVGSYTPGTSSVFRPLLRTSCGPSGTDALVFAGRELELQFRMSRPLTDFMATLHKNCVEEKRLSKFVSHALDDDVVSFMISFPEEGQYGLDIYTRELGGIQGDGGGEKHLLTHCCKYLINSSKRN
uniref:KY-like immunoglobulin-like domain-containing protein n=1 Tax=Timema douglasi TaxID=61478 RepID=A0A7R8VH77_TIMDO|nr:unnamed protein product [Timema douglasi]